MATTAANGQQQVVVLRNECHEVKSTEKPGDEDNNDSTSHTGKDPGNGEGASHLERLYDDQDDARLFTVCDIARDALEQVCAELTAKLNSEQDTRFGISHSSSRKRANVEIISLAQGDTSDVLSVVTGLEAEWKRRHSVVYQRFIQVCNILHSHKAIFSIFPSQNLYASVICGTISSLIKAAVNHDTIAETISRSLEQILKKTARCALMIHVIKTESMKRRLAEVYSHFFYFLRDIVQWYLKSRTSRFFASFNDHVNIKLSETASKITELINEMDKEAELGGLAMQRKTMEDIHIFKTNTEQDINALKDGLMDIHDILLLNRQESYYRAQQFPLGNSAGIIETLLRSFDQIVAARNRVEDKFDKLENRINLVVGSMNQESNPEVATVTAPGSDPNEALSGIKVMKKQFFGANILAVLADHQRLSKEQLVDERAFIKLRDWLQSSGSDEKSLILSIYGLNDQGRHTTQPAAFAVVATAFRAKVACISHICKRPKTSQLEAGQQPDKVGMIGLVYNLIYQLLQFRSAHERQETSEDHIRVLDGSEESWPKSLKLLTTLLEHTPQLGYCVIDGLNALEASADSLAWCSELLEILRSASRKTRSLKLLFTLSGKSRTLQALPNECRFSSSAIWKDIALRGKRFDFSCVKEDIVKNWDA